MGEWWVSGSLGGWVGGYIDEWVGVRVVAKVIGVQSFHVNSWPTLKNCFSSIA